MGLEPDHFCGENPVSHVAYALVRATSRLVSMLAHVSVDQGGLR
jgi:hypothetical protein